MDIPSGNTLPDPWLFRGITAAASLKLAISDRAPEMRAEALPRHHCRGLIEALSALQKRRRGAILFRGITAAASLKLRQTSVIPRDAIDTLFRGITAAASLKRGSSTPPWA